MYATASPFNIFMGQFGSFLALASGFLLPPEFGTDQEYADNTSWRWIFGFAYIWIAIGMVGFLCIVRLDTPKFYISQNDEDNAIKSIH